MERDLKSLAGGSSFVFFGKICEAIFLLVINLLAARLLELKAYGDFTYLFTIMTIIGMITKLGIDQGIMSFLPLLNEKDKKKTWGMILFTLITIVGFNLFIIFILLTLSNTSLLNGLLKNIEKPNFLIFLPLVLFISTINVFFGVFRSIGLFRFYIFLKSIILPSVIALTLVLIFLFNLTNDFFNITISYYIGYTLINILLIITVIKSNYTRIDYKDFYNKESLSLLKFSSPLFLSSILGILVSRTDQVMIGSILNNKLVGIYNIVFQISLLISFVLIAFNTIFAPKISLLYKKGEIELLENLYKTFTRWITIITVMLFFTVLINGEILLGLFGAEFKIGYMALIFMAAGQVVNAAVGSVGYMNTMTGRPQVELYTNILTLLVNFILNLYLIPIYGINGAAFASFIAVSSTNLIRLAIMHKNLKFHPFTIDYLKIFIAGVSSWVLTLMLKKVINIHFLFELTLTTILFLITFSGIYWMVGLNNEDKRLLLKVKDRYFKAV
ncbi:flippase [Rossellomorea arthrocnemi]